MWRYNDSDYLAHYGTLGMRWGRRKGSTSSGSKSSKPNKQERAEEKAEARANKKEAKASKKKTDPVKNMSDEELKSKINRLEMEKKYKKLENETKTTTNGSRVAKDTLAAMGTVAAATTAVVTIHKNARTINKIISEASRASKMAKTIPRISG